MKILVLIICLSLLVIPAPAVAQESTTTLEALSLGPASGGIAWNAQGDLLAVGGYTTLNIHDAEFNVAASLENYQFGSDFVWAGDSSLYFVAFTNEQYQIRQWQPSGEQTVFYESEQSLGKLTLNADNTLLAGLESGSVRTWSITTGEVTSIPAVQQDTTAVSTLAWNPTENKLAIAREQVYIWDVDANTLATVSELPDDLGLLAGIGWQANGDVLAIGTARDIYLWAVSTNEITILAGHTDFVRHLTWAGDSWMLASGSDDGTLQLWDTTVPIALVQFFQPKGKIQSITVHPVTQDIYVLDDTGAITTFDPITQETGASYYGYVVPGELTWTADGTAVTDGAYVWDVVTGEIRGAIPVPLAWSPSAQIVAWNAAGTQVAYINRDGIAIVVQDNAVLYELDAPANYFAWSPDGSLLATYAEDGATVTLWQNGELAMEIEMPTNIVDLSWDSTGQQIAILGQNGGDSFVRVYDAATGEQVVETEIVVSGEHVLWSPDGAHLWAESGYQGLYIFDSVTGKDTQEYPPFYAIELSPDGSRFVAKYNPPYENTTLGIYDSATFEPIVEIPFDYQTDFSNMTWSPDGSQVAVVLEGVLYLWQP